MNRFYLFFFALIFIQSQLGSQTSNSAQILEDLKKLKVVGSVLYVAAHPDDENTRLISYLSNELKLRTSYVSLTRGDGGQNLIGPELDELLGVIRTQELLEARKIDGGQQYFTRANDFGYSKTAEETFSIWEKDTILLDLVRLIRTIQPDVIINRFDHRTSGKTHGHHTASAILAKEAFDQARNSLYKVNELKNLEPVRVSRLLFNTSWFFWGTREKFEEADKSHLYSLDIGAYYPALGLSNGEVSARSRSMHKSQGFGINSQRGSQMEYFERLDAPKGANEISPFDGLNLSWSRFNGGGNVEKIIDELIKNYDVDHPELSIPLLQKTESFIEELNLGHWKEIKLKEVRQLIFQCAGIYAEAYADEQTIGHGEHKKLNAEFISRLQKGVLLKKIQFLPSLHDTNYNTFVELNKPVFWSAQLSIPSLPFTSPFWLLHGRGLGHYEVDDIQQVNASEAAKSLKCAFQFEIHGKNYVYTRDVVFKKDDPVLGEVIQGLDVLPAITVKQLKQMYLLSSDKGCELEFEISSNIDHQKGKLSLEVPAGITVTPESIDFQLEKKSDKLKVKFLLYTKDFNARKLELAIRSDQQKLFTHHKIEYPHISWQNVLLPALVNLTVIDLKIKQKRVAYIDGAGDFTDEAIRDMGFTCTILPASAIETIGKSDYDVLVFGIRAFNTQGDLKKAKPGIERFANEGGKVIFQYNTSQQLVSKDFLGDSFRISRARVTDENSPVEILIPEHPVFTTPNKITTHDFEHWVQERGLYFPDLYSGFDELLSFTDPGEKALHSGLLVKKQGKGYLIYSSIAWFRQLPAGVPGAFRLWANLLSF
ncbi:MAG: PIG-L family deacetylase [Saprospiraceae bacterium]|nr:PIG-L family deacetylase [Saprospiraceae bacterium]